MKKIMKLQPPHVGQRIVKSTAAVFICFVIYHISGNRGIPFYSAIAALQCIQPFIENSGKIAWNRVFGTFNGAFWGSAALYAVLALGWENTFYSYTLYSLLIIAVLLTAVQSGKRQTAYFSCVVFLCITAVHGNDSSPFMFVLTRVTDTLIGIAVALAVNVCHIPKRKRNDILFVSALDDTLVGDEEMSLLPYSKILLNHMIHSGAHFTIVTGRSPASAHKPLEDISINLPIVTMNGAAIYDMGMNKFVRVCKIPHELTLVIERIFNENSIIPFITVIVNDVLLIYFDGFNSMAMQDTYRRMRPSPYRNYIPEHVPSCRDSVYFYAVDTSERVLAVKKALEKSEISSLIKVMAYPSTHFENHMNIKVYSREADKRRMIEYIAERRGLKKIVTFGSIEGEYDYIVRSHDYDGIVRKIKSLYFVPPWQK
ncbi:MAG: HAD hydrolase family protein [Candidatus Ornithomonoglobus sp.]